MKTGMAKAFYTAIIALVIAAMLTACTFPIYKPFPKEGEWYCEELMIGIDFGNQLEKDCYAATKYSPDGTNRDICCGIVYGYMVKLFYEDKQLYEEFLAGYEEARLNGNEEEYIRNYEEAALNASEVYLFGEYYYRNGIFYVVNNEDKVTYIFERIDE